MEYEWDLVKQLHPFFWKNNLYFGIYIACLILLFLFRKKEGWKDGYRAVFWYSIVAMIVICYNPLFAKFTFKQLFFYDMSVYVRVYLLLPILFTVAYVFSGLIAYMPRILGDIVLVAVVVLIIVTGETPQKQQMYVLPENPFKINTQAIMICDAIDQKLEDGERCRVYIPRQYDEVYGTDIVTESIRQYDANIILDKSFPYEKTEGELKDGSFFRYMEEIKEQKGKAFVVCLQDEVMKEVLKKNGFCEIGETDNFCLMEPEGQEG